jgi:hypothetical protein
MMRAPLSPMSGDSKKAGIVPLGKSIPLKGMFFKLIPLSEINTK